VQSGIGPSCGLASLNNTMTVDLLEPSRTQL
jgi:hypothetical protein